MTSWFGDAFTDIVDIVSGIPNPNADASAGAAAGSAVNGFSAVAATIASIWADLTNGKMWRSLGWLALGLVFLFTGGWMLIKNEVPLPPVIPV